MKTIKVYDVIHSKYAAYQIEGDTVFKIVEPLIEKGEPVMLSFQGVA